MQEAFDLAIHIYSDRVDFHPGLVVQDRLGDGIAHSVENADVDLSEQKFVEATPEVFLQDALLQPGAEQNFQTLLHVIRPGGHHHIPASVRELGREAPAPAEERGVFVVHDRVVVPFDKLPRRHEVTKIHKGLPVFVAIQLFNCRIFDNLGSWLHFRRCRCLSVFLQLSRRLALDLVDQGKYRFKGLVAQRIQNLVGFLNGEGEFDFFHYYSVLYFFR